MHERKLTKPEPANTHSKATRQNIKNIIQSLNPNKADKLKTHRPQQNDQAGLPMDNMTPQLPQMPQDMNQEKERMRPQTQTAMASGGPGKPLKTSRDEIKANDRLNIEMQSNNDHGAVVHEYTVDVENGKRVLDDKAGGFY